MDHKSIEKALVLKNEALTPEIYEMILGVKTTRDVAPGQFINLYCKDGSRLLPRPISICEVKENGATLRLIYKVLGKGTEELATLQKYEEIDYLGPLGKGFSLEEKENLGDEHEILIIGGGVGVPPLLELVKQLKGKKRVLLGFEKESILIEDFQKVARDVAVATTTGDEGIKGTVLDLLERGEYAPVKIYSCGPKGMLKAVKDWGTKRDIPMELSLEERMACGIGACLVCTCKIQEGPHDEDWNYQRVCKDGPVFKGEEVMFE